MAFINNLKCGVPAKITLPTIYDTALSYMEIIYMIANRVEDVIKEIEEFDSKSKQYTDEQVAILRDELARTRTELTQELLSAINELNKNYTEFTNLVNSNIILMQSEIRSFDRKIDNEISAVNERTDNAIKQNNEYLLDEIGKGFVNLRVLNYFTGESVTVQEMFDYLAQFHLNNAITYNEFNALRKTYSQLAQGNYTYTNLAVNGKTILGG